MKPTPQYEAFALYFTETAGAQGFTSPTHWDTLLRIWCRRYHYDYVSIKREFDAIEHAFDLAQGFVRNSHKVLCGV